MARRRLGSAPTSKGLFSRCVENVSRYEAFVRLYSFFFGPSGFRNLREYLLVIYLNSFWHKTYFIHRILKRTAVDARRLNMAASDDQVSAKIQVSKLSYLAKALAALILHSYQNYALFFTSRFPLFHSRPME